MGNDRPLFSVIVLLYNQAHFVEETLDSVHGQTIGSIELLVCDDASTDGSAEVAERWCREHASRFLRWKVIRQPKNRGILPNQLSGIRASTGALLKTLAADDLLLPDALEAAAGFFTREPGFGLACGGVQSFRTTEGGRETVKKWPGTADLPLFTLSAPLQYRSLATRQSHVSAPSVFARREVYEAIDLASTRIRLLNDYPTWLLATLAGFRFGYIGRDTTLYRRSPSSVSQNASRHGPRTRRRWLADHVRVYRAILLPNADRLDSSETFHVRARALKAENRLFNGNRPFRRLACSARLLAMSILGPSRWKALFGPFPG